MVYQKSIETKKMIVNASKQLFKEQGFRKTTIRQIATKVNDLNSATLYYYFKSKDRIAEEIYAEYYEKIIELSKKLTVDFYQPLLFFYIQTKIHFKSVFATQASKKFYLEIFDLDWFDEFYFQSLFDLAFEIANYYEIDIDKEQIILFFIETGGAERNILLYHMSGRIALEDEKIINYIIKIFPKLLGINEKLINDLVEECDMIIKDVDISQLNFFGN
ncbi:TetR/AcrR family transcriptional regulator [Acetobacterium wieringae]|uniref:Putative HTH-type transcriptional regulator YttP n=1 Tax=Acetobacterium wieringae TaxID=52694 RepID=A0A1F2PCH2_9FIRM|nr:TetR/AcrR family transcriptional regulator [Acetobacterium wieringae]OFV68948.1 putative HTH-type transcriptional regulator YttP [Acetobacterium wieringae]